MCALYMTCYIISPFSVCVCMYVCVSGGSFLHCFSFQVYVCVYACTVDDFSSRVSVSRYVCVYVCVGDGGAGCGRG